MKNNCNFASENNMKSAGPLMKALFDIFETGFNPNTERTEGTTFKFPPLLNIVKGEDSYKLEFLIPGASKEDIKITYDDKVLTVSYTKTDDEQINYMKKEFGHQNYERKMRIRPTMDLENMTAEYNGGILTLTIPTKEQAEPTVTEVNVK